jgi:uncharacterized membrane protein
LSCGQVLNMVNPRMSELQLILPYYCYKSCEYDTGLVDGYILGVVTMALAALLWVCYIAITEDFEEDNKKNE